VTQHLNYILVRNQDDMRFEQLEIMQNLPGGFGDKPVLMASNLKILAPFENDEVPEYKA